MKAVVMAGGEGTRLRPMTASMPKPLLPIVNKPIMEHVLRLLRRHGVTETVVTVQFLASLVRNYFGDGEDAGMVLHYATEETPLGTAGSVKNAEHLLDDGTFIVISGDALTDFDLTDLVKYHHDKGALVTVCLTRVPDPLEFGITIVDDDGRVQRFLEKPTWGQVFSDTVNTGIYVMEPEVFEHVAAGEVVDWSGDVFPKLVEAGLPIYGYVAEGYWEDVGTHDSYFRAQADVLSGKVDLELDAFEVSPGVYIAEGADVHPDAVLRGPLYIGDYAKIEAGAELREFCVLGSNVVVKNGAFLHRAVVHDNVFIGPQTNLRACVIGKNTDIMRAARVDEGAIIGDECVIGEEALVSAGIKIYPFKTVDAGAVVNTNVIFESRGQRTLFGPRGVSGIVNVEITPELAVRLASAWATTLKKGTTVTTSRDVSRAARALKRAVIAALTSSAINVVDLEVVPVPVARLETAQASGGGVVLRTTPGQPESVDIVFLDGRGADLSQVAQRRLERTFSRGEYRRAFPGEIGDLAFPPRVMEAYALELLRRVDTTGVSEAGLKVVVDTGGGTAALVLPSLLGRLGVDALTVNNGLDETSPTETTAERREALKRLGTLVSSSRAAFGVHFDPVGERISIVDERGGIIDDERALLVTLDLVAAERRLGRVALPVTTTRLAEQVAAFHGVQIDWISTAPAALTAATEGPDAIFGGDGRGGFVVPAFSTALDGFAAFVQLIGLVARTKLPLSEIDRRIPQSHIARRSVPTPWAAKGMVMRAVIEDAGERTLDTTDGVRVVEQDGSWALVLPDPAEPVTHLWAEAADDTTATHLLETWADVVSRADS
ncbi:MAG: mannose-phosphate guanylyltransferase / phosphomannomutase [Actinomycetota bacterium]|jgi:mannose-1-phosphate guanylyltransferase/phosphomannomutase|nr:mannose-phosphate guanylyltransferase / phosphomannomutase [Actinomycetota bacterium]